MTVKTQREIAQAKRKNDLMLQKILAAGKKAMGQIVDAPNYRHCRFREKDESVTVYFKESDAFLAR